MRCSNGSVHQATAHRSGQRGTCSCSRLSGCSRAGEVSKQTPFFPHLSHSSSTEGTGCQASPRSSLSQALPRDMEKQLARSFWRAHKEGMSSIFQVCLHQFRGWETASLPFLWLQQKVGRMNFILTTSLLSESLPLFLNLHIFMCLFSGLQQTPAVGRSCQCKMPRSSQGNFSSWFFSQARKVSQLV